MADPIRILLVEDHAFTRDGLRATLNLESDLRVRSEARSGEEALERLAHSEVDVAVLDIGLPGMDGIQTAAEIKRGWPAVRIVMLTAHDLREEVFAALASGADAYCLKSAGPNCSCSPSGRQRRAARISIRRWRITCSAASVGPTPERR